jgi:hydrogenase maturation protease
VLGLGNPILTDDGVGIHVARTVAARLASQYDGADGVGFAEASVGGMRLLDVLAGSERVILVDAIQTPGGLPGDIHRFLLGEVPVAGEGTSGASPARNRGSTLHSGSTHDLSLQGALAWGEHHGMALPAADHIVILAIEAQDVLTFGEACTPAVAAAVPRAADCVLSLLEELNG